MKLFRSLSLALGQLRIRGFIASASLKLGLPTQANIDAMGYPRLYRLGLIEASVVINASVQDSGGYPRLYRLGLIEAVVFVLAVNTEVGVSEALSPRPH